MINLSSLRRPAARKWASALQVAWLGAAILLGSNSARAEVECGSIANGYGPFDYRSDRDKLKIVEDYHFTPEVEALVRAKSGYLGSDLDYTLRAFPNHHRALIAISRYSERLGVDQVPNAGRATRCYFVRAIQFRPDDTTVRMLFAQYLHRHNEHSEAVRQLDIAREYAGLSPYTHYNLGLVYAELGEFESALKQAHIAMAMGFQRTELKERLVAAQRWREPAASSPP